MDSWKYLFFFLVLIVRSRFGLTGVLFEDEEKDRKYMAFEETLQLLKKYKNFNVSEEDLWDVMPFRNGPFVLEEIIGKNSGSTKFFPSDVDVSDETVKLRYYTPEQPDGVEINIHALNEFKFNPSNPTKIVCHGWLSSVNKSAVRGITDAYLAKGNNNVISVDWNAYANNILYPSSMLATKNVGKYVANFIDSLVETREARYSDFHVIGHSLGAHIAGFIGNNTKEKIGRITGLDPALPGFQYVQAGDGRLDVTDATFVDIIHTCSGLLGMSIPIGHVDFFPNGGSPFQPGCTSLILTETKTCSHGRSYDYFAESIASKSDFTAVSCEDWDHFKNHHCDDVYALMGEHVSKDAHGVFYLRTNDHPPFGKGFSGTTY